MAALILIDADRAFAVQLSADLTKIGVAVRYTTKSQEAIASARVHGADAIVISAELPVVSGYSVCAQLKKDERLRNIPVVITSSAYDCQQMFASHKQLRARADAYIRKPFTAKTLLEALRPRLGGVLRDVLGDVLPEIPASPSGSGEFRAPDSKPTNPSYPNLPPPEPRRVVPRTKDNPSDPNIDSRNVPVSDLRLSRQRPAPSEERRIASAPSAPSIPSAPNTPVRTAITGARSPLPEPSSSSGSYPALRAPRTRARLTPAPDTKALKKAFELKNDAERALTIASGEIRALQQKLLEKSKSLEEAQAQLESYRSEVKRLTKALGSTKEILERQRDAEQNRTAPPQENVELQALLERALWIVQNHPQETLATPSLAPNQDAPSQIAPDGSDSQVEAQQAEETPQAPPRDESLPTPPASLSGVEGPAPAQEASIAETPNNAEEPSAEATAQPDQPAAQRQKETNETELASEMLDAATVQNAAETKRESAEDPRVTERFEQTDDASSADDTDERLALPQATP